MKNNHILNALCYLVAFLFIQFVVTLVMGFFHLSEGKVMLFASMLSGIATIALFAFARWSPFSRVYLQSRPWTVLMWVGLLACGLVIPSEWILERLDIAMPEQMRHLLEEMLKEPTSYFAIGILTPVAEEMVFRGAILRSLLIPFRRMPWVAIVLSALLFGMVHGNVAQFIYGTILGLLLGWMYHRSGSIVPGIVLHWVNNTIVYVVYRIFPQAPNGRLADFFGGDERVVWHAIGFSICILIPSFFQVVLRLKNPFTSRQNSIDYE